MTQRHEPSRGAPVRPPRDDLALLAAIGGECAGAVALVPDGAVPALTQADPIDLEALIGTADGALGEGGWGALGGAHRLSLAGAQDKLAVVLGPDGQLRLPAAGEPSTHLIKPDSPRFPGLRDLEALGLSLARQVGLSVPDCALPLFSGVSFWLTPDSAMACCS